VPQLRFLPLGIVLASIVSCAINYFPVRARPLAQIANDISVPYRVVESAGIHDAVVFSPYVFAPRCKPGGGGIVPRHYLFWRPNNDPDLTNDILWVNHLSVERDLDFMKDFPDRRGY